MVTIGFLMSQLQTRYTKRSYHNKGERNLVVILPQALILKRKSILIVEKQITVESIYLLLNARKETHQLLIKGNFINIINFKE